MFLSIIIPHYNLERPLLERCLQSITLQEMAPDEYEVLVVDDGSQEPPLWVREVRSIANLQLIELPHGGLGAARNAGLERARGQYHLLLDSDDYLYPRSFTPCLHLLRTQMPQLLSFEFKRCSTYKIEPVRQKVFASSYIYSGGNYMLLHNVPACAWHYFFSRELVQRHHIRFTEGILHEDEEFTARIYYFAQTAIHCNRVVYAYYHRSGSIVASHDADHVQRRLDDTERTLCSLLAFWGEQQERGNITQLKGLRRKIVQLTCDYIANMHLERLTPEQIAERKRRLHDAGLFPLPPAPYGTKYRIFRLLANYSLLNDLCGAAVRTLKRLKR